MSAPPISKSLLGRLLALPSYYVLLLIALLGFALIGGSFALGLDDVRSPGEAPFVVADASGKYVERQTGYLAAFNWSITYALLFPLAAYLMLESLRGIWDALEGLYVDKMVRNNALEPANDHLASTAWRDGTRERWWLLLVVAGAAPLLKSLGEWFFNNFLRLVRIERHKTYKPSDYDWGLASIMPTPASGLDRMLNAGFDLLAFCSEGLLLAATLAFFVYLLDLARVLPRPNGEIPGFLVPNLRSKDQRRGFEQFEDPLHLMLMVVSISYVMCYLIRINRLYMRSAGFSNVLDYLQRDILLIRRETDSDSLIATLLTAPGGSYQDFFAGIATLLVFIFSFVVVARTVGKAARRAQANAIKHYANPDARALFGLPLKEEQKLLADMTTWPLGYLKVNLLLVTAFLGVVSLWFYRIGIYVFVLTVVFVLAQLKKRLSKLDID